MFLCPLIPTTTHSSLSFINFSPLIIACRTSLQTLGSNKFISVLKSLFSENEKSASDTICSAVVLAPNLPLLINTLFTVLSFPNIGFILILNDLSGIAPTNENIFVTPLVKLSANANILKSSEYEPIGFTFTTLLISYSSFILFEYYFFNIL